MNVLDFNRVAIVDLFPILTVIPWASYRETINHVRKLYDNLYDRLYTTVQNRLERSEGNGSFMEEAIIHSSEWGLKSEVVLKSV